MSVPGGSMCIFPASSIPRAAQKRHWTFAETQFGPEPQPLMELLAERGLAPVVICESAGTQAEDACTMQQMYRAARDLRKIL